MTSETIIADASPLISLERIERLDLMARLFERVTIPPAVAREVGSNAARLPWLATQALAQPLDPRILRASLGPGESEAMSLALELGSVRVILDDEPACRFAQALGLPIIGTLGVLIAAERRGVLVALRPTLDALLASGYRLAPELYEQVWRSIAEDVGQRRAQASTA